MPAVKVCGIREPEHAVVAVRAGTDLIGMVFAESRRRVTVEQALAIAKAVRETASPDWGCLDVGPGQWSEAYLSLRAKGPLLVGVFVNAKPVEMQRVAEACGLDAIQLSGDESWELCEALRLPVLQVVHVGPDMTGPLLLEMLRRQRGLLERLPVMPVLDTAVAGEHGGTGRTFDWGVARAVAEEMPVVLSGGLAPGNVADAIRRVWPWAVDVSSGVETAGVKDPEKIRQFITEARRAEIER